MPSAIRIHKFGGPEVLLLDEVEVGTPGPGEVRLRQTAVGINMSDVYRRRGMNDQSLPYIPGVEGAGIIEAIGDGVDRLSVGDRAAYADPTPGSYADCRLIAAEKLVALPDEIGEQQAAAIMLKGLTVHYLLYWVYAVQAGDVILIHAAAGGVGLIFCQWAKHLGATVIGTVGTDEKAEIARAHGCDHPINYAKEDFVERVRDITGGEGCAAVYDSVAKDTVMGSLQCLRPRGVLAGFGSASGPFPPLDTDLLRRGSFFFTRPTLAHFMSTRADYRTGVDRLFGVVLSGVVKVQVSRTYPLAEATEAHRALESRRTTGSIVLLPSS